MIETSLETIVTSIVGAMIIVFLEGLGSVQNAIRKLTTDCNLLR